MIDWHSYMSGCFTGYIGQEQMRVHNYLQPLMHGLLSSQSCLHSVPVPCWFTLFLLFLSEIFFNFLSSTDKVHYIAMIHLTKVRLITHYIKVIMHHLYFKDKSKNRFLEMSA